MSDSLKKTIDRMVEDAIRRVLPTVMNEVLLQTIANAGVLRENRAQAPAPKQQRREAVAPTKRPTPSRGSLRDILGDPSDSGADFYDDPRVAMNERLQDADQEEMHEDIPPIAQRIRQLPPELQAMTEGMNLDIDQGEMWGDGEHDSASLHEGVLPDVPLDRAAKAVGLDFNRMANLIKKAEPPKQRTTGADAAAKAQFEEGRIARQREMLDRKP